MELGPGLVIADRYRLERLLGEGGMGMVWSATHLVTLKQVALKFLKAAPENDLARRRFLREARTASAVRHPAVLEVHDIIEHEGIPVMVLDLLEGESLAARLARQGRIPLDEFAAVMLPVVSAVGTAHSQGIVHRDLKPDNIFLHLEPDGTLAPKVLDFGIAKLNAIEGDAAVSAHLTTTGAVMGTPYYMAPEQVFGEKDLDQRADVWAMGVICYECLSGHKPIEGDNLGQLFKAIVTGNVKPTGQIAPHLPKDMSDVVDRMLTADRKRRPENLRELFATLKRYASTEAASFGSARQAAYTGDDNPQGHTSSEGYTQPTNEHTLVLPLERRRWPLLLGAAVVLSVAGVVVSRFSGAGGEAIPVASSSPSGGPASAPSDRAQPALEQPPLSASIPASASAALAASTPKPPSTKRPASGGQPPAASVPPPKASTTPPPKPTRVPGQVVEDTPF